MPITPEDRARDNIDKLLGEAGWIVQHKKEVNLAVGRGVAVREFPMKSGHGEADYLLFVDGAPIGVVEAKKEGDTLTGVELQTTKYSEGVPDNLTTPRRPLPFQYQSTGVETRFTNLLEPDARSRRVFSFHRAETLDQWLTQELQHPGSTLRAKLRSLPELRTEGLRPAQIIAIENLEASVAKDRPRALIQMASGGGKTFTACNFIYRLIKHAGAKRILFLVDRSNLGRQAQAEFQKFRTPEENRLFTELYNVQRMQSNKLDDVSKVCITTIQRLYAMLQGEELDPELEEQSGYETSLLAKEPAPVAYNPSLPIETFDFIVTDECHRSIYNLWRQVLEYFDSFIIGLTATPSKQTLGFFNQNLVMEYSHEQAVADSVNVGFEVYRIRTLISERGSTVNAGFYVDKRDKLTRKVRWQQLEDDFQYGANELDRSVVAKDQIRTIIQSFRDRLFTEIFPGRTEVPKTLIFAKDDSHADDIVQIVREEFGKGNDFAQKITYRTGTARVVNKKNWKDLHTDELLRSWHNCLANDPQRIGDAARAAVKAQLQLGCEMIILPGPLTTIATQQYAMETAWIDAGLEACKTFKVGIPVLATVAISDSILRGVDPTQNPLLQTITNQLSARGELAGAYVLPELASENGYVSTSRDTLLCVLLLIDDLVRGAGKVALVNYVGTFGAVASAAGASVWSSGYYRGQRRLKLADFEDQEGRARPRYHSLRLAGDIGLQSDIESAYRQFGDRVLTDTKDGLSLMQALASGTYPPPEWEYTPSNIQAAGGHYNEIAYRLGQIATLSSDRRIETVKRWLEGAVIWSDNLQRIGITGSSQTELTHQAVWLNAFQAWRSHAGL